MFLHENATIFLFFLGFLLSGKLKAFRNTFPSAIGSSWNCWIVVIIEVKKQACCWLWFIYRIYKLFFLAFLPIITVLYSTLVEDYHMISPEWRHRWSLRLPLFFSLHQRCPRRTAQQMQPEFVWSTAMNTFWSSLGEQMGSVSGLLWTDFLTVHRHGKRGAARPFD